jgi:hypothetical protein
LLGLPLIIPCLKLRKNHRKTLLNHPPEGHQWNSPPVAKGELQKKKSHGHNCFHTPENHWRQPGVVGNGHNFAGDTSKCHRSCRPNMGFLPRERRERAKKKERERERETERP